MTYDVNKHLVMYRAATGEYKVLGTFDKLRDAQECASRDLHYARGGDVYIFEKKLTTMVDFYKED